MVEQLNAIARLWWDWSAAMFWQAGLLILLIGCIDLLIRRWAWPQLRYALWLLILIKLVVPPTLSLPSGIVPELRPVVGQAFRFVNSDKPAAAENAAFSDFGLQISDLTGEVKPLSEVIDPQSAGWGISNSAFQISNLRCDTNPQSEINNPQFTWQVYAMLFWLAGTLILGIWLFLRLHSLCSRRAYQAAAASLPQSFYNQMADCANRLGLRHVPRVVVTRRLASPAVFGAFRPVLLMPKGYLSKLSRRDTEHMLLHELAHVKRGDLVMHSLYMLLQIAYWYNPLLWLVRRQMHHLRELSCDATVANLLRERTLAYRQTLLETARRLLAASVEPGLGLLGLFEDSNRLLVRLNWLTKPTWRYRTMKRAIVVAIAALMIACVLPMAQARQSASNEVNRVTQDEPTPVRTEGRDQQSQDRVLQDLRSLQRRLDQMMAEQRVLRDQLRILATRRHEVSLNQENGRQYDDQMSQDVASLQKHLEDMMNQQQDLQKQLRALADERRQAAGQRGERSPRVAGGGRPGRERADQSLDVTVPRYESSDRVRPPRDAPELRDEAKRELQEHEQALDQARMALDDAKRAAAEAGVVQARVQRDYADRMKAWAAEGGQWEQSEQMQQWRRQMENWQQKMQEWAQNLVHGQVKAEGESPEAAKPAPMPPMPKMPEMPKIPAPMRHPAPMREGMNTDPYGDMRYEDSRADLGDIYGEDMPSVNMPRPETPVIDPPHVEIPVIEPPVPPIPPVPEVPAEAEGLEEAVQRNGFGPIPGDRVLEISNHVGSITVRSGDEPEYVIRATVRGRAQTKERAGEIASLVEITDTGLQNDGVERIIVGKPQGLRDREHCIVTVEVTAPRNAQLKLRQEIGDIRLIGLRGSVDAFDRVGAIRASDIAGQVALNVEVGGIDLSVPKDLSARVSAKAELGGIQSDLPLEFTKARGLGMGSSASGTIGRGDDDISLTTKMGTIRIRSQGSEPAQIERDRPERPEPRPEPLPKPGRDRGF
jgi:beta-lactamase regulating signal transducer with metallopeptidase domain